MPDLFERAPNAGTQPAGFTATVKPAATLTFSAAADPVPPESQWDRTHAGVKAVLQKDLFFVLGCQKSGTTWVQQLLDEHPEIICRGEGRFGPVLLPLLQQTLRAYNERHTAGPELNFTDQQLEYLFVTTVALALGNAVAGRDVKCVGEKTPEHSMLAPAFARIFPRSRFIHVIRDGRDGVVSGWFHGQRVGESFTTRFKDLADYVEFYVTRHWIPYIQSARSVGQTAPHRYFELRYEDLLTEPEPIIRRMLEFLGVDPSDDAVRRCRDNASFEKLARGRKRGDEDRGSFYRKGVAGDWKNHFDDGCVQAFARHGGEMLRALGYEP
jgi:hypothetical protein